MTSTPVTILEFRSGQSRDRPFPESVTQGQLALSFGASDPGLYFIDSANSIRKIGGAQYGTKPNDPPQGQPGNSVGELWADGGTANYLRIWDGQNFIKVGAGFADRAEDANHADRADIADFALSASGVENAQTADFALRASGCDVADFALLASGCDVANFATAAGTAESCLGSISTIFVGALPNVGPAGSAAFNTASGYLYISTGSSWQQVVS